MADAWRAYLELALGLTEASRKKAEKAVKNLVGKGFGKGQATAVQLQARVEELVATSRANREALAKLVRYEVDRALGAVGLATSEEVSELTDRVRRLERQREETTAEATGPAAAATSAGTATAAAAKATPKKTVAKKTVAKKAVAKQTTAKQTVAKQTAAKRTAAKKTVAKKTVAKKAAPQSAGTAGA